MTATLGEESSRTPAREATADGGSRLAWSMAAVLAVIYAVAAIRDHQRLLTAGFDLGIFEQVVRSYAGGHLGLIGLKGPAYPQLGDHFSPILMLLAPVYRLFPSPVTLLVAQALLFAVAVVPIVRLAHDRLGRRAAWVAGAGYGLSWGIAEAVGFDFHEIAFAVPMLAFSLAALARRRLREAALWALPLLLVKEDLGLTVAVIGLLIAAYGDKRLGVRVALAGILGTLAAAYVFIPAFNPGGAYAYTNGSVGGNGITVLFEGVFSGPSKALTLLALLAPTALLALRSPLVLAAVPTLAWRFASENHFYWGRDFHYSAVLMPIVFVAFVDGLRRWRDAGRPVLPPLLVSAVVTVALIPSAPLAALVAPGTWKAQPRAVTAGRLLALIPDGATVAASNDLIPHLTSRATVTEFVPAALPASAHYILFDAGYARTPADGQRAVVERERQRGYTLLGSGEGIYLLSDTRTAAP